MTDRHEHLDEGTIHAWLDGALTPDESTRVESLARACTECAALVAEARGLVAASSRILSSLDAVPGGVIPGVESGADQLAALRARRRETSRRWWSDRRFVAAASLLFVAGVSGLVWRSVSGIPTPSAIDADAIAVQPVTDSAMPTATAPASAPSEQTARDAKVGAAAPVPSPAPRRLATSGADSVVESKVAAAEAALSRRADVAANEARRADSNAVGAKSQLVDSIGAQRATQLPVAQIQLQQGGAAQGQQALRQRAEQLQPAPPTPAFGAGARLGPVVTTGVGAAAPAADFAGLRRCYRLTVLPAQPRETTTVVDSVQLLNETLRERGDSTWRRARAAGWASDSALVWRQLDSTTVELRSRIAANPLVLRFSTIPGGQPLPDLGREAGVRAALAGRVICPR